MKTNSGTVIPRDALLPALQRLAPLVPSRNTVPIVGCAQLDCAAGALRLAVTNLEATMTETVDVPTGDSWSGCADVRCLLRARPQISESVIWFL
jgi:DNA polymerase III sliding clamp (beta) subunit (PCNA family)